MGVVLGTLTTKDGVVLPLSTAAEDLVTPVDEYRKEEERRYAKCVRRPITHGVWDNGAEPGKPITRTVALYLLKTQNLKLQGETMKPEISYDTNAYKVFEYVFTHPKQWLGSADIGNALGLKHGITSALLSKVRQFLRDEELIVEKDKDGTAGGKLIMFKAECENPLLESRLWYNKALEYTRSRNKKPVAKGANPQPQVVPAPKTSNTVTPVQVDTATMEAIVRVPLTKLASVLKLLQA